VYYFVSKTIEDKASDKLIGSGWTNFFSIKSILKPSYIQWNIIKQSLGKSHLANVRYKINGKTGGFSLRTGEEGKSLVTSQGRIDFKITKGANGMHNFTISKANEIIYKKTFLTHVPIVNQKPREDYTNNGKGKTKGT